MKKIFYLLAVVGVVLTGCKDTNSPENANDAFTFTEDVSKPLEFDGSSAERALSFTAQADWSVSIQQGVSKTQVKKSPQKATESSATWITVSPMSGQKGRQQITITCAPNDQNEERSITIIISDGTNEIKITVVQEKLSEDFDVFTAIEDPIFLSYCEQFDRNKDGKLSLSEANTVISVFVHGAEGAHKPNPGPWNEGRIFSLKGIEFFKNLDTLECGGNRLTSLNVSSNTKLRELKCWENQLTSLNVSGCRILDYLDCAENQLTSLNVSACIALSYLDCYNNQLTSFDMSGCKNLEVFNCSINQLKSLDVTGLRYLEYLGCYNNQLTSLDVSKNTKLETLLCVANQLTTLDVSKNTNLQYLVAWPMNTLKNLYVNRGQNISYYYADNYYDYLEIGYSVTQSYDPSNIIKYVD